MSYVLHIWGHPKTRSLPKTIEEAERFLAIAKGLNLGQNPQFILLAKQLTAKYSCICSPQPEVLPESEWAWSDGPLDGKNESGVYSIGLNTSMLDEVHPFVIKQANSLGLCVMDEQAGKVYLSNGSMLGAHKQHAQPNAAQSEYDLVPKRAEVEQIVFDRLVPFLQKYGYKARKSNRSFKCVFPTGWHEIKLYTMDKSPLCIQFSLGVISRFAAVTDLVVSITKPPLPPEELKDRWTTMLGQKKWLDEEADFIFEPNKEYIVRRHDEIDFLMSHLLAKLETRLMPILDQYKSIEGLDQLMNPMPISNSIFFIGYEVGYRNIITAYLARNPNLPRLCAEFTANLPTKQTTEWSLIEGTKQCIEYVSQKLAI